MTCDRKTPNATHEPQWEGEASPRTSGAISVCGMFDPALQRVTEEQSARRQPTARFGARPDALQDGTQRIFLFQDVDHTL